MPKSTRRPSRTKPRSTRPAPKPSPRAPSRRLPYYHIDAFTSRPFHGNPAGVVLLGDKWIPDDLMQSIAAENNLAETAFFVRKGTKYAIRWFSPTVEIDLCGHATIASAHVLWNHEGVKGKRLVFSSKSGELAVERAQGGVLTLDFPARPGKPARITSALCAALGREPAEVYQARDLLAVFNNKREVHELRPDFDKMLALDAFGIIVTAPGAGHDFVSRFFAPKQGIPEDPATGSSHCTLVPYWSDRLNKTHLTGHQVSHRGGEMFCELRGKRVRIGGHAVTYSKGTVTV